MSRGIGEAEFAAGLPDPIALGAALVTALGDAWFVFLLFGALYWFGSAMPGPLSLSRRQAAFGIAVAFGGFALTTALKELFRLPRPPGAAEPAGAALIPDFLLPLYAEIGAATGFGFPSGHAISAIVVYGGLALLVDTRRGYAVAVALCVLLPLSRIVLGVHYLVDVVAGLAVGGAYLAVVFSVCDRGSAPGRAMAIAVAVALVSVAIGYTTNTMIALGGAFGAWTAWRVLGSTIAHAPTTRIGGSVGAVIGIGFGGLFAAVYASDPVPHIGFVGLSVVIWGVLSAPIAGEAIVDRLSLPANS